VRVPHLSPTTLTTDGQRLILRANVGKVINAILRHFASNGG
jgi:hypothetical protein